MYNMFIPILGMLDVGCNGQENHPSALELHKNNSDVFCAFCVQCGGILRRLAGSAMDKEAALDHLLSRLHAAYRYTSPARQLWRVAA